MKSQILKIGIAWILLLGMGGFGIKGFAASGDGNWVSVAKTRQALEKKISPELLRQLTFDDLKQIASFGPDGIEDCLKAHRLIEKTKWVAAEIVDEVVHRSRMGAENKFRLKIILDRTVAQAINVIERTSNNPPSPDMPAGNNPPSPY